jgi:hypothetical protein
MLLFALQGAIASSVVTNSTDSVQQQVVEQDLWKPDPVKAVWMGTLFPGLGQIYNRSYWKLPIVYGGLMGCTYAIIYTDNQYQSYKEAYRSIYYDMMHSSVTNSPEKPYIAILPEGYTIEKMGGVENYYQRLKEWQNTTRRYRDLSIAATVIVYALTLVDAYVDAQLFDFDISPDLTLNVNPHLHYDAMQHRHSAEVKLAIAF